MQRASNRFLWIALVAAALAMMGACSGDDPTGPARGTLLGQNGAVMLSADPAEIVIDPADPEQPKDPETNKLFGETTITGTVLDAEGNPRAEVEVVFSSTAGVLASGGEAIVTDAEGVVTETLRVFEDDPDEIEVTASTEEVSGTIVITKRVVIPNEPPVADAGEDVTVECAALSGSVVTLDGSGSTDPDSTPGTNDDIVSFEWFENFGGADEVLLGEGETLEVELAPGAHVITLRVTDSQGETATDEVVVTVADTTPPVIEVHLDPTVLWPPDHRLVDITAHVTVEDACSVPAMALVSVTSNEPDNGTGDGDTAHDIQGIEIGAGDLHFRLRAERAGPYPGRIYEAVYAAMDDAGNTASASATVVVPHDQAPE